MKISEFRTLKRALIPGLTAVFLLSLPAAACRFNVREVGFTDLDLSVYRVTAWLPSGTPPDLINALEESALGLFYETNLQFEVNTAEPASDQAQSFGTRWGEVTPPVLLIESPERRTLAWPLPPIEAGFIDAVTPILHALAASPARNVILEHAVPALAIVLFFEGEDPDENAQCRAAIEEAFEQIVRNQHALEKPAEAPGHLVAISSEADEEERMLLWSVGMSLESPRPAQAAILFGKARRMGTILSGEYLQRDVLVRTMALAGASCECGLDRNWMQGPRIPLRWDRAQRERLAKSLGFDPESPLIKMEISQILNQSGLGTRAIASSPMMGYSEAVMTFSMPGEGEAEAAEAVEKAEGIDSVVASLPVFPEAPAVTAQSPESPPGRRLLLLIAALVSLNLVLGIGVILWRKWSAL